MDSLASFDLHEEWRWTTKSLRCHVNLSTPNINVKNSRINKNSCDLQTISAVNTNFLIFLLNLRLFKGPRSLFVYKINLCKSCQRKIVCIFCFSRSFISHGNARCWKFLPDKRFPFCCYFFLWIILRFWKQNQFVSNSFIFGFRCIYMSVSVNRP